MNSEIISKIKPEVTSPRSARRDACQSKNPFCRRGTITTQGHAKYLFSPYRGSQRGSGIRGGQGICDLPWPLL